jgi:hypothetical protein
VLWVTFALKQQQTGVLSSPKPATYLDRLNTYLALLETNWWHLYKVAMSETGTPWTTRNDYVKRMRHSLLVSILLVHSSSKINQFQCHLRHSTHRMSDNLIIKSFIQHQYVHKCQIHYSYLKYAMNAVTVACQQRDLPTPCFCNAVAKMVRILQLVTRQDSCSCNSWDGRKWFRPLEGVTQRLQHHRVVGLFTHGFHLSITLAFLVYLLPCLRVIALQRLMGSDFTCRWRRTQNLSAPLSS